MPQESNPRPGDRFSQIYLGRGAPAQDSKRFRMRLIGYLDQIWPGEHFTTLGEIVERELGITVRSRTYITSWREWFGNAELRDVLDAITLVHRLLPDERRRTWRTNVERAIREENLGYRVDDRSIVHYNPDEEFERNRVATIAALGGPRYGAALAAFTAAQGAFDERPPNGKAAIRDTFEAAETLFKLIFDVPRLGNSEIQKHLRPAIQKLYAGNEPAMNAANQLMEAFGSWTNAGHQYRHGQALEEPAQAPLAFAVAMVSTGASYIRWLAEIDAQL